MTTTTTTTTSATSDSTQAKPFTQTLPSRKPTPPKLLFASLSMRSRRNPDSPDARNTNDESTPVPAPAAVPKAAISRRASASLLMQKTKHMLRAGLQKTATLGSFQRWQDIKDKRKGKEEREREKVLTLDEKVLGPVVDIGHGHACGGIGGGDETEDRTRGIRRANGVQALFEMPGPVRTGGVGESGKLKEGEEVESEHPIGDGSAR